MLTYRKEITPFMQRKKGLILLYQTFAFLMATSHNFNTIAYPYLNFAYPLDTFAYPRGVLHTPYSLSIELPNIVLNCFISFLITEDNKYQLWQYLSSID